MSERERVTCREAIEQLWAYIDDELPQAEAGRIQDHLENCVGCHPHHDVQRAFHEFLKAHAGAQVPAQLRRRVFLRLLAEERGEGASADA